MKFNVNNFLLKSDEYFYEKFEFEQTLKECGAKIFFSLRVQKFLGHISRFTARQKFPVELSVAPVQCIATEPVPCVSNLEP